MAKTTNKYGAKKKDVVSQRIAPAFATAKKLSFLAQHNRAVKAHKIVVASYLHTHIGRLIDDPTGLLSHCCSRFVCGFLYSWELREIVKELMDKYTTSYQKQLSRDNLIVQNGPLEVIFYQRDTKNNKKGDVKGRHLPTRKPEIARLIDYIATHEIDLGDIKAALIPIQEKMTKGAIYHNNMINEIEGHRYRDRILKLALVKRQGARQRVKPIVPSTGTYQKPIKIGKSKYCDVLETPNSFKYFLKFKVGRGKEAEQSAIYIPLATNEKYHEMGSIINASSFKFKMNEKNNPIFIFTKEREHFALTSDAILPENTLGIDVNSKHNLMASSDGRFHKLLDDELRSILGEIERAEKKAKKAQRTKDEALKSHEEELAQKYFRKAAARAEAYIKRLIAAMLLHYSALGIRHIAMEELSLFATGKSFAVHPDFAVKYSQLIRKLRLSSIAAWVAEQAQKYGIRVHLVHAYYTSQECVDCSWIDDANRLTQEEFKCKECSHAENADTQASKVIKKRISQAVLRDGLLIVNKHGNLEPKKIKRIWVKEFILKAHGFELNCLPSPKMEKKVPNSRTSKGKSSTIIRCSGL